MQRFWLKSFMITAAVCAFFAASMATVGGQGNNEFATIKLNFIVGVIEAVYGSFVAPLGIGLATAIVAAVCLFVCGFFAIGKQPDSDVAPVDEFGSIVADVERTLEDERHGQRMRRVFGTASAYAEREAAAKRAREQNYEEQRPDRQLEAGRQAARALETNGFDWFFAHFGDGYSDDIYEGLKKLGYPKLAEIARKAGAIYAESQRLVIERDRDLDQEETTAYFERMYPLDREAWALYKDGDPR